MTTSITKYGWRAALWLHESVMPHSLFRCFLQALQPVFFKEVLQDWLLAVIKLFVCFLNFSCASPFCYQQTQKAKEHIAVFAASNISPSCSCFAWLVLSSVAITDFSHCHLRNVQLQNTSFSVSICSWERNLVCCHNYCFLSSFYFSSPSAHT